MIYALALLAGLVAPATSVGVRVLLPDLIEDTQLEAGNAWLSATEQFSYLVGPALAGILVGVLGGPAVLLLDAISFLAMTIILYSLPNIVRKASPVITDEPLRGDTQKSQSSFRTLLGLKQVWIITSLSFVFFLSYGPLEPALPLYSQQFLKAEASGYGLLWSAFGVGAVLGLVVTPYLSKVRRSGITFASIALLWGLFLAPLTWLSDLPMAMLFLGLAGCAWAPYNTLETSILQRLIPAELRGQVFGVRATLLSASTPVGVILGGILLDFMPSNEVIGISALACILVGVAGLLSPAVRTITRRPASIALVTAERLSDPE
jgi:MFS family permease